MSVGEKLKSLRGKKSRRKVANDLGISYSMYMKLERDERSASDDMKKKICCYYNQSIEYIFFSP
jgi:transcriptional regulator with XRE-family HTH domain